MVHHLWSEQELFKQLLSRLCEEKSKSAKQLHKHMCRTKSKSGQIGHPMGIGAVEGLDIPERLFSQVRPITIIIISSYAYLFP